MLLLTLREEIICTYILAFLIFYYSINMVKDQERFFLKISCVGLAHVLLDIATVITVNNRDTVPHMINHLCHIMFYITGVVFVFLFYQYVVERCVSHKYIASMSEMAYMPLGIFVLLLLSLPMEYYSGKGTDHSGGPLAIGAYTLILLYCIACFIIVCVCRKKLEPRVKYALVPMFLIMFVGVIAQALVPELLMTGGNITLICIGLFVALENPEKDQALRDFLTGLKNRNCLVTDLARVAEDRKGKHASRRIGIIVADMNYLKTVNDQFGHAEGDKLLIAAATILREQLKSAENIYRSGGDEFVAIYLSPNESIIKQEMDNVNNICLTSTNHIIPLRIAMGYASGNINEDINSILEEADQKMYIHKTSLKEELSDLLP